MDANEFGRALMDYAEAWSPLARPTTRAPFIGYIRTGHLGGWGLVFTRPAALAWAEEHHPELAFELARRQRGETALKLHTEQTRVITTVGTVMRDLGPKDPPWFWVNKKILRVKLWHATPEGKRHVTLDGPGDRRLEFDL